MFENTNAEDGILLNHEYIDMRGYSIAEARDIVADEAALLADIEAAGDNTHRLDELLDEHYDSVSDVGGFDIGMAGAIAALSAASAAPISSCNGGLLGEAHHASDVPNILFSIVPSRLGAILAAAEVADVGLINNSGHVEVFADVIPNFNLFAKKLLAEIEREASAGLEQDR